MKVGLVYQDFSGWHGGYEFLMSYLCPLNAMEDCDVTMFVRRRPCFFKMLVKFVLGRVTKAMFKSYITNKKSVGVLKKTVKIAYYDDFADLNKQLSARSIDVIFPAMQDLHKVKSVPYVPYVYDFQHKYIPDLFSKKEIADRDKKFAELLAIPKAVVVEAKDVESDIHKFYPNAKAKVFVMPYTAVADPAWLEPCPIDTMKKYGLKCKYFLISNQFWIHKSHATAFNALHELYKDGIKDVDIVCTGNTGDYRNPGYFDELKNLVRELGMSSHVHFLGLIPKIEQIDLMKHCIAVIQPTLFEGNPGGGVAYNAVSLDVPIILSDIPVNLELVFDKAVFFKAKDFVDLKDKMKEVMQNDSFRIRKDKAALIKDGEARMKKLQQAIREMLEYVIGDYHDNANEESGKQGVE